MMSLFQTAAGSWHVPSILMASSWFLGTILTGVFMVANLRVNRDDRLRAASKAAELELSLHDTTTKLTAAEKSARDALRTTSDLERRHRPRGLSPQQQEQLKSALAKYPAIPILVSYTTNDPEATAFGREIADLIKGSGYPVTLDTPNVTNGAPPGLTLAVHDGRNTPMVAPLLQSLFKDLAIDANWTEWPEVPTGTIWIKVGPRQLAK